MVTEVREESRGHGTGGGTGQRTLPLLGSSDYDYYASVQCPLSQGQADTAGPGCSCPEGMEKRTRGDGAAWCQRVLQPFRADSPFECYEEHPPTHYATARWVGPGKRDYAYTCIPLGPKPTCMSGCEPITAFNKGWVCPTSTQCALVRGYVHFVVPVACVAAVGAISGVACAAAGGGVGAAMVCGAASSVIAELLDVCPEIGGG